MNTITGNTVRFNSLSEHDRYWVMDRILEDKDLQQSVGLTVELLDNGIQPDDYVTLVMNDGKLTMFPK